MYEKDMFFLLKASVILAFFAVTLHFAYVKNPDSFGRLKKCFLVMKKVFLKKTSFSLGC